jgi:hypothetical protein
MVAESARAARAGASDAVVQLVEGVWLARAVHVAVSLGIPDLFSGGSLSVDELAAMTSTHAPAVERIMRALAGARLLEIVDGRYSLTDAGALLRRDAPDSLHPWVLLMLGDVHQGAWAELMHTVRTGESAFCNRYGIDLWEYCAGHPDHARLFAEAMAGFTTTYIRGLLDSYSFAAFTSIVDVGGGDGRLLVEILRANVHARGVVVDRPEVVVWAQQRIAEAGIADRGSARAGDAIVEVPAGGDAYILSRVLHDWDDDIARRILVSCRDAAAGGRILVIERVMPDSAEERAALSTRALADVHLTDLNMMVMTSGRERTLLEWERLFAQADLGLERAVAVGGAMTVLELSARRIAAPQAGTAPIGRGTRPT